jgi:DNA-binding transcriptional ArsR family regulator
VPGHEDARIRRGYELDAAARSDSAGGRPGRGVLESGFRILRALPDADQRRHVSSVAEIKSIPRSTVHRPLLQLRQNRAIELRADGRWAVSPHLLRLAPGPTRSMAYGPELIAPA